nr:MAG TPA: hypothetical protein [Caudoviricetes sp.]
MDRSEMLACLSKFDAINEEMKRADKSVYMSISFTRTTFSDEIKYDVCAIDKDGTYIALQFENFADVLVSDAKPVNFYYEILEALKEKRQNE